MTAVFTSSSAFEAMVSTTSQFFASTFDLGVMKASASEVTAGTATIATAIVFVITAFSIIKIINAVLQPMKNTSTRQPFHKSTNLPPSVPNAHFYFGHFAQLMFPPRTPSYNQVFADHMDPATGISAFWHFSTPSISVTKAQHAKILLRNSVERHSPKMFLRHFQKTMGKKSLIYLDKASEWRAHRTLVQRAFTQDAVRGMGVRVWKVADSFAKAILNECCKNSGRRNQDFGEDTSEMDILDTLDAARSFRSDSTESYYKEDALNIFKWVTIDVFGAVALGYDFQCTTSLQLAPLAASFDYAVEDMQYRTSKEALLNPLIQSYRLPTERNRRYQEHSDNVRGLFRAMCAKKMKRIIERTESKEDLFSLLDVSDRSLESDSEESHVRAPSMSSNESSSNFHSYSTSTASISPVKKQEQDQPQKSRPARRFSSINGKGEDLLTILLKSKDENNQKLSHQEVTEILMTLFYAGYDTSSIVLSYAMYCLAKNPDIQTKCANEIRSIFDQVGDEDPNLLYEKLAFCRAVIMETLRLHSPVIFTTRSLEKDVALEQHVVIPKGTRVYIPLNHIHTHEWNYARGEEFLPERWVKRDETSGCWIDRDHNVEPSSSDDPENPEYLPPGNPNYLFAFSDGARNCPGRRLAVMESTMVLACIVKDLVVDVPQGFDMEHRRKFVMVIPKELPLIFRERP